MNAMTKSVLITGANSGIGLATAKIFLEQGDQVCGVDLHLDQLLKLREQYGKQNVLAIQKDIAKRSGNEEMIQQAIEHFGRLDVLINNAGMIDQMMTAGHMTDEMMERVMRVNFFGPFYAIRFFINYLEKHHQAGAIVSTSSVCGVAHPTVAGAAYASSKAALIQLTKHVAYTYGKDHIRANAVCVGAVPTTGIAKTVTNPDMDGVTNSIKINKISVRNAQPAELGHAIAFLAGDDASYVNGEIMNVDGGWSCA